MAALTESTLDPVAAPNLLRAPPEYDSQFQELYSNALRLYFNRLSQLTGSLVGTRGGRFLNMPYAAIQRTTNKTFTANTVTQITFDTTDFANGCTNNTSDGIVVAQRGLYNYQFSIQLANTDTQIHTCWVWLRKNGVDIAGTGSKFDCNAKHGTSDGYLIATCNFFVALNTGDSVELMAAVDSNTLYMEAYAAQTSPFVMPSIPSVVATLMFISEY